LTAKGKKRGRPLKGEGKERTEAEESAKKAKRTLDRFNGMSVEEVMSRKLPDVITPNLDLLIVSYCFIDCKFDLYFIYSFYECNHLTLFIYTHTHSPASLDALC